MREIPPIDHLPIHNPPQLAQVLGATILIIEIVGMFPNIKGENGAEAVGDGVVGAGVLADGKLTSVIGLESDPSGAEDADAFGFKILLEGVKSAPLGLDLGFQMSGRGRA